MTLKEAIEKILADAGKPLHYKEIADIAVRRKLMNPAPRPAATVSARLSIEMKKGANSTFVRVTGRPGVYGLRGGGKVHKPGSHAKPKPAGSSPTAMQVGKAGEYLVASELLFRGLDVWTPSVDSGTDLVADKDGRRFDIQVKTGNKLAGGFYQMAISIKSFNRLDRAGTFYVFVMRDANGTNCVILTSTDMDRLIAERHVKKAAEKWYVVRFVPHEDKCRLGGKNGPDVGYNINNWGIIK